MDKIQHKREQEKRVVAEMIALYCSNHHGPKQKRGLCPDCAALLSYAQARSDHCPFMESKTFCVNCTVHCYQPEMRAKIREVMRWSGPRMLFHHPILAISHAHSMLLEKNRRKNNKT